MVLAVVVDGILCGQEVVSQKSSLLQSRYALYLDYNVVVTLLRQGTS